MSSKPPTKKPRVFQLKVTLRGVRPPIWRRLQVRGDATLEELHHTLQIAMGWTNSHLHQFAAGGSYYGMADFDFGPEVEDERRVRLQDVVSSEGDRFDYEYDFGDSWDRIDDDIPEGHWVRVVREDPVRENLLFAGTEMGVYFSLNAGKDWTRLHADDLPVVPITDLRIQRELRLERGSTGRLDVVDAFLQRIDQIMGRPDDEVSFASSVKRLSSSFQQLADKPEDPTLRSAVVNAADRLADDLNHMSDAVQQMRLAPSTTRCTTSRS